MLILWDNLNVIFSFSDDFLSFPLARCADSRVEISWTTQVFGYP